MLVDYQTLHMVKKNLLIAANGRCMLRMKRSEYGV